MTLPYMGAVVDGTINYNLKIKKQTALFRCWNRAVSFYTKGINFSSAFRFRSCIRY